MPLRLAIASSAMKPMLCRLPAYCEPGLPSPTRSSMKSCPCGHARASGHPGISDEIDAAGVSRIAQDFRMPVCTMTGSVVISSPRPEASSLPPARRHRQQERRRPPERPRPEPHQVLRPEPRLREQSPPPPRPPRQVLQRIELKVARNDTLFGAVDLQLVDGREKAAGIDALLEIGVIHGHVERRFAVAVAPARPAADATLGASGALASARTRHRRHLFDARHGANPLATKAAETLRPILLPARS